VSVLNLRLFVAKKHFNLFIPSQQQQQQQQQQRQQQQQQQQLEVHLSYHIQNMKFIIFVGWGRGGGGDISFYIYGLDMT
jgi:hypothetical protein